MKLFIRFFFTGAAGAVLSIAITWLFTTFVFGTAHYFEAYLIGIAANLIFNFVAYTIAVFKTTRDHVRRLFVFLFYGLIMAALQATTVQLITAQVGVKWYLLVIACTIAIFAVLNFFVFKLSIFKEHADGGRASMKALLTFVIICAVLLRLAVLFHVLADSGVAPLVYGDAIGYRALATNLAVGNGFVNVTNGVLMPEVFRSPGLPLILAPFSVTDNGMALYFFLLAIIGGILLPYLTYKVGKRVLPAGAALLAAIIIAFEPHLVFYSVLPQTEVPFILFAYGGLLSAWYANDKRSMLYAIFAGALFGYAVLIKPGFFPVLVAALIVILIYQLIRTRVLVKYLLVLFIAMMVVLSPWYARMHEVTGVYALSGQGWRNVYTDYLASVRAVADHTNFDSEKTNLKNTSALAGVSTSDVDNPASAEKLKQFSLGQLWQYKGTVIKLEAVLMTSFFTQDGYYYEFRLFQLVPNDAGVAHTSATFDLLNHGIAGIPAVMTELANQLYIPIVGRIFTVLTFIGAIVGFFVMKNKMRWIFALVIGLTAVTSTVIGLGVDARLRLPIEPLLFIFFACACARFLPKIRFLHEN